MAVAYTIGYEGADMERFITTLKMVGVEVLADVRAVAHSRKKGFSKTALRERLEEEGITYIHFIELGDPKPGREAARAGRYSEFRRIYARHLSEHEPRAALSVLGSLVREKATCLLCFERDPSVCHRSIVAERLTTFGVKTVLHLYGDTPSRYAWHASKLASCHSGQGAASA